MSPKKIITIVILSIFFSVSTLQVLAQETHNVSVTAAVEPGNGDLDYFISSSPGSSTTLNENNEVTYTISYISLNPSNAFSFTLVASWDQGLIAGTSNNIDIFNYVVGSATNTFDNTSPTIDLQNRKITWEVTNLPPVNTTRTVSFKLKVRSDLPTDNTITASVKVGGTVGSTTLTEKSIDHTIRKTTVGPTSTPIPGPTSTPGPTETPTSGAISPTVTPPKISTNKFEFVEIKEVSNTAATIRFKTTEDSIYFLSYGTDPKKLVETLTSTKYEKVHLAQLENLTPNTKYYFKIKAQNKNGQTINSDLFTFRTASYSLILNLGDITISSQKVLLSGDGVQNIIIPKNLPLNVGFKISKINTIAQVRAKFHNTQVLGINSFNQTPLVEEAKLIETSPGLLSAEIKAPGTIGTYEIVFNVIDKDGSIYTTKAPYLIFVSDPLKVIDEASHGPIENASIQIFKYEESFDRYSDLAESIVVTTNTDQNGEAPFTLPSGKYRMEIKALGYKQTEKTIALGTDIFTYPVISLTSHFSVGDTFMYYRNTFKDVAGYMKMLAADFFTSKRVQNTLILLLVIAELMMFLFNYFLKQLAISSNIQVIKILNDLLDVLSINFFLIISGPMLLCIMLYSGLFSSLPMLIFFVVNCILLFHCVKNIIHDGKWFPHTH